MWFWIYLAVYIKSKGEIHERVKPIKQPPTCPPQMLQVSHFLFNTERHSGKVWFYSRYPRYDSISLIYWANKTKPTDITFSWHPRDHFHLPSYDHDSRNVRQFVFKMHALIRILKKDLLRNTAASIQLLLRRVTYAVFSQWHKQRG